MTRSDFLAPLIGQPWAWRTRNCWDFACHVQRELFGRALPCITVPDDPKWKWMVAEIGRHPERENWMAVPEGPHGLVKAVDGALCLMGRFSGPGHVGVWLADQRKVIHCDRKRGVCLEDDLSLKQQGWIKRTYYEPRSREC
ncbi:hypothetical protein SAMN03159423_4876 [Bradyrhizobium sp. NFR13]|uniref:hypothetical protein n=1 Tax=Bradyrhizobium sp. NFR13 TaxID=1566285 RepID=UPI0008F08452|nr:hypothetical protein [Bradyrhizobium sp. NFR13]SFM00705.1 hypothetical protein SAMN03159423_4876 [Bradyrhizobium sp. NFR13]